MLRSRAEYPSAHCPAPDASREALLSALDELLQEASPTEATLRRVAAANPYRTLSGLLEAAACQHKFLAKVEAVGDLIGEAKRLRALLEPSEPFTPPTPDAFLFSRLLFALASSTSTDAETKRMRKRYALTKPGASVASMHDVARKFSDGIKRFQEGFMQATLSKTPSAVVKMAASVATDAHRLESPAFTSFAALMAELTTKWTSTERVLSSEIQNRQKT